MKRQDKIMFGNELKIIRKAVLDSYKIQRMAVPERQLKEGKQTK